MQGELVEREIRVKVRNPLTGMNYNPVRYEQKTVLLFDKPYGPERREIQEKKRQEKLVKWQKLTPEQQLKELDRRLGEGVGASNQRAKIKARIEELEKKQKNKEK